MSSDEIKVGSSEMMTHAQRQAFLKTSPLGKLFGVAHLLPEVTEATEETVTELPHLKRVRGLFKHGKPEKDQYSSDAEVVKPGN